MSVWGTFGLFWLAGSKRLFVPGVETSAPKDVCPKQVLQMLQTVEVQFKPKTTDGFLREPFTLLLVALASLLVCACCNELESKGKFCPSILDTICLEMLSDWTLFAFNKMRLLISTSKKTSK